MLRGFFFAVTCCAPQQLEREWLPRIRPEGVSVFLLIVGGRPACPQQGRQLMTTLSPAAAERSISPAFLFRFLVSAVLAIMVTAGLFMLMLALIHDDSAPEPAPAPVPQIDISFDIPDRTPVRDPLPEIEPVVAPPAQPIIPRTSQPAPGVELMALAPPAIAYTVEPVNTPGVNISIPPLTGRVEPVYPQRELSRGLEGSCTVRYDILASGRTANLQVTACDSTGFARASLAAVARWSHAMEVGRPGDEVVRRGVETRLDFQLE